jgi:CRP/FNR family cyclic AMP-dependent transcriptional regulator
VCWDCGTIIGIITAIASVGFRKAWPQLPSGALHRKESIAYRIALIETPRAPLEAKRRNCGRVKKRRAEGCFKESPRLSKRLPFPAKMPMIGVKGHIMATKRRRSFDAKSFLARVGDGRSISKYRKSQIVFSQGDPGDAVFYIQKGKAKLTVVSEQGKEAVIAILGADEFFGEGCLAGQAQRIATVTAMSDSVIARLEKAAIIRVIHEEPAFSELFIAHLLGRSIRVEADLVDQLFNSSEKRLARLLLLLANFGKEGTPEPVIAKISQETLAEMIGTTRSRVSFFMNKFRKLGFIDYNGGIEVHSSLLNVVLHDQQLTKN